MIQMDEFHITVLVPKNLPQEESDVIYRTLHRREFVAALKKSIKKVFQRSPSLKSLKVRLSR